MAKARGFQELTRVAEELEASGPITRVLVRPDRDKEQQGRGIRHQSFPGPDMLVRNFPVMNSRGSHVRNFREPDNPVQGFQVQEYRHKDIRTRDCQVQNSRVQEEGLTGLRQDFQEFYPNRHRILFLIPTSSLAVVLTCLSELGYSIWE
ncbi:hypothetical protein HPB47_002302 [Ixodes persulcatus]|uniref:Uncharacterized protein n=1 Tax=Ixodes persulcatus TaxID=34615 RepID=A0AC60PLL8_IXOPE|nr:hypothetical protein HPB47_002302 [Ixodes persulcatus]